MAHPKIPLRLRIRNSFGWDTFLTLQKPSAFLFFAVPVLAAIRGIAAQAGYAFDLPIRLRITVIGSVSILVAYLLVKFFCPKTIRIARNKSVLKEGAGLPEFARTMQEEIDKSNLAEANVSRTLINLFQNVEPRVIASMEAPRGDLFAAMAQIKPTNANLDQLINHGYQLFVHTRKGMQWLIGFLVLLGIGMLAFNFCWALFVLLKPAEIENGLG